MKRKIFTFLILFVLTCIIIVPKSEAYQMNFSYWPDSHHLHYYLDSSVSNDGYSVYADYGAKAWNISSSVEVYKSTSSTNDGTLTTITTSKGVDLGNFYADAHEYTSSGSECQFGYNCKSYRGKIRINDPDYYDLSSTRRYETITHEMGHILGLAHEDYVKPAIMMSGPGFLDKRDPQADDWAGIKAVYPY
jgi:hypothetical protein